MKPGASHSTPLPSSKLRVHEDSHLISKNIAVPKIRIIHIFAPKIIKTDEANFRELVQSLTGQRSKGTSTITTNSTICQPEVRSKACLEPKRKAQLKRRSNTVLQDSDHSRVVWKESNHQQILNPVSRKTVSVNNMTRVMKNGNPIFKRKSVKKELVFDQDTYEYKGQSSNLGFLMDDFSDMDGLFQDPSEFLPKYPQINIFGGMPWSLS